MCAGGPAAAHKSNCRMQKSSRGITQILCLRSSWGPQQVPLDGGTISGQLVAAVQQEESYRDVLQSNQLICGPSKTNICYCPRVSLEAGLVPVKITTVAYLVIAAYSSVAVPVRLQWQQQVSVKHHLDASGNGAQVHIERADRLMGPVFCSKSL